MVENDVYICPPTPERVEFCSTTPPLSTKARIRDLLISGQLNDDNDDDDDDEDADVDENSSELTVTTSTTTTNATTTAATTALPTTSASAGAATAEAAAAANNGSNADDNKTADNTAEASDLATQNGATASDTADEQRPKPAASPPPNCAICLGKISSKCFTDSCMHQFCFSCLLEWSKIKAECPLCKQAFKSIIHNVTSMDKYDEYKVQLNHWPDFEIDPYALPFPRFRLFEFGGNSRFYRLFLQDSPQIQRFAREYMTDNVPSRTNGAQWRAYVYRRSLYAMPLPDLTGRTRDISARFLRQNPAQVLRLMTWVNRDILSIVPTDHFISQTLNTLHELIVTFDMTSDSFRRRVRVLLQRHTDHFIHELINFARSPYDMIGYDRDVQYRPYFDDDVQSILSSGDSPSHDSDNSSLGVGSVTPYSAQQSINSSPVFMYNFNTNQFHSTGGDSAGAAGNRNPNSILLMETRGLVARTIERLRAATTASSSSQNSLTVVRPTPIESVNIESGDSDDCQFVSELKPPHLRTPEMVELNSETDSDVMIINDTQPPSSQATENIACNRCDKQKTSKDFNYTTRRIQRVDQNSVGGSSPRSSQDGSSSYQIGPSTSRSSSRTALIAKTKRRISSSSASSADVPYHLFDFGIRNTLSTSTMATATVTGTATATATTTTASAPAETVTTTTSSTSASTLAPFKYEPDDANNSYSLPSKFTNMQSVPKLYGRPKRRGKPDRSRKSKTVYDSTSTESENDAGYDDDIMDKCKSNTNTSSSSESSHEEFTVGKASGSRKRANRSRRQKSAVTHKKKKKSTAEHSPKRKLNKIYIKREKNANYRLVDKCLSLSQSANHSTDSSSSMDDCTSDDN